MRGTKAWTLPVPEREGGKEGGRDGEREMSDYRSEFVSYI